MLLAAKTRINSMYRTWLSNGKIGNVSFHFAHWSHLTIQPSLHLFFHVFYTQGFSLQLFFPRFHRVCRWQSWLYGTSSWIIEGHFPVHLIMDTCAYSSALISSTTAVTSLFPSVEIERIDCNCGHDVGYIQDTCIVAVSLHCVDCDQCHFLKQNVINHPGLSTLHPIIQHPSCGFNVIKAISTRTKLLH